MRNLEGALTKGKSSAYVDNAITSPSPGSARNAGTSISGAGDTSSQRVPATCLCGMRFLSPPGLSVAHPRRNYRYLAVLSASSFVAASISSSLLRKAT